MTATTEAKPWDFSHVLDLVNSLSYLPESPATPDQRKQELDVGDQQRRASPHDDTCEDTRQDEPEHKLQGLGDFTKLWQFLGPPAESSSDTVSVQATQNYNTALVNLQSSAGYASDGVIPSQTSSRARSISKHKKTTVPLRDLSETEDQAGDTVSDGSTVPDTPTLTKSQRKKKNRKERRAREAALAEESLARKSAVPVSDTEANNVLRKTPSKAPFLRIVDNAPTHQYNLRPKDASGNETRTWTFEDSVSEAVKKVNAAKKAQHETDIPQQNGSATMQHPHSRPISARRQSNPSSQNEKASADGALQTQPSPRPVQFTPLNGRSHHLIPSTVPPITRESIRPTSMQPPHVTPLSAAAPQHAHTIQPMAVRSGEDRNWALFMKLIADFYEDRKHLISPMNLTTHNNDPKGIHVFVDASNIFIGFRDQLKRSRGIPWHHQVPAVGLSFDALALLMERRRPVAKRVLVGSTPHLAAFDKAKAVGYECSILEKVYKARELTERQVFFKEQDHASYMRKRAKAPPANNVATLKGRSGSGSGSGSETNAPQYAPARMIEQGVDEILHLKILESIVDTDVPGTIVLATGDAARAEYSEGFMAMAERALKKGWTVELVSWSTNISATYKQRAWVEAWGERFRIVLLDDYAEELLDM